MVLRLQPARALKPRKNGPGIAARCRSTALLIDPARTHHKQLMNTLDASYRRLSLDGRQFPYLPDITALRFQRSHEGHAFARTSGNLTEYSTPMQKRYLG